MKKIEELYKINYYETNFSEDDYGESFGITTHGSWIEFNREDCVKAYIAMAEDGIECNYEKLDDSFTKAVKNLDEELKKTATVDENRFKTLADALQILFDAYDCQIFDVEKRYCEKEK